MLLMVHNLKSEVGSHPTLLGLTKLLSFCLKKERTFSKLDKMFYGRLSPELSMFAFMFGPYSVERISCIFV